MYVVFFMISNEGIILWLIVYDKIDEMENW